jgi:hypothetical protein
MRNFIKQNFSNRFHKNRIVPFRIGKQHGAGCFERYKRKVVTAKINVFFVYWESAFGASRAQIFIRRALRTNDKFVRP